MSILDALQRHKVRATFFWIGEHAERHHDIVRRTVDDGHYVGNHSYSHPFLTRLDHDAIRSEVMRADAILEPYYHGVKLFRPPHGDHDERVDQIAAEAGYQTVMWNLEHAGLALAVSATAMGQSRIVARAYDGSRHCLDARRSTRDGRAS